jgi:hypothetical protein
VKYFEEKILAGEWKNVKNTLAALPKAMKIDTPLILVKPPRYFSHSTQSPARIFSSKYFKLKKRPYFCSSLKKKKSYRFLISKQK